MKVPSNRLADMLAYYTGLLRARYEEREARAIVWLIFEHFLGVDRMRLALEPDLRVSESQMLEVHFPVKEVANGMPVQYVTGVAWFAGMDFIVTKDVLIPRPETEGLLEIASNFLHNRQNASVLDACTGSGCLAVSVKLRHPSSAVVATDVSADALGVAGANAKKFGTPIRLVSEDLLSGEFAVNDQFDLIISNPPYIPESERSTLQEHVLAEPALALFVPDDNPLVFYHALARRAKLQLKPGGLIAVECHADFAAQVARLFSSHGLANAQVIDDYHGRQRFALALKA